MKNWQGKLIVFINGLLDEIVVFPVEHVRTTKKYYNSFSNQFSSFYVSLMKKHNVLRYDLCYLILSLCNFGKKKFLNLGTNLLLLHEKILSDLTLEL